MAQGLDKVRPAMIQNSNMYMDDQHGRGKSAFG